MATSTLKFAPSILSRLGEELVPNFDQGIIELVRNSYDADANKCTVTLKNITQPGGEIVIKDDGIGMDGNAVANSWLVIGHSNKRGASTTGKGRIPVGDKGLGRLAALRMGEKTKLNSIPVNGSSLSTKEYSTEIVWSEFETQATVDKVSIEVKEKALPTPKAAGTRIAITNLKKKISRVEAERLARNLMILSNPFGDQKDFSIEFVCEEYPEVENIVKKGYLHEAEWFLESELDENGMASATVKDWKGDTIWQTTSDSWFLKKDKDADPVYKAPPAKFEISIFSLDKSTFVARSTNIKRVTEWLKALGGVHIYHNDFRVHPYGDPGSDWLDMNLARVNAPSIRPSTNTSIGRVLITDQHKLLQQKTDRVGFLENSYFAELKRFVTDSLNWYAKQRSKEAEAKKKAKLAKDQEQLKEVKGQLEETIKSVRDPQKQKELRKAAKAAEKASENVTKHLKNDLKLYRSLATAGTTTAVFSHEISKPLDEIPRCLASADRLVKSNLSDQLYTSYQQRTGNILKYMDRLSHFAKLQLDLLKKDKRRNGVIHFNNVIADISTNFTPLLTRENINLEMYLQEQPAPKLSGATCILEAIVTNCLTNSMRAFQSSKKLIEQRLITIRTSIDDGKLSMEISDNGPGITEISIDDIWLPGVTTMENGTGFGLTIIKDSVTDLGGSCRAEAIGPLGGATFYFEFNTL